MLCMHEAIVGATVGAIVAPTVAPKRELSRRPVAATITSCAHFITFALIPGGCLKVVMMA